ncbi:helix-turn-helix transcriptional regulator [Trinickia fusca]|uniref:LuxR family transcriptional regulator n=1 Tax=Trinickia fusca TaxID=2419777 RepID=A0A494XLH5_9BURK|nr:LuxR family transcriptional regulator [Trinickia fusca]RKP50592.1 LuxR family transcriptional regulator [Trinickia fusca]
MSYLEVVEDQEDLHLLPSLPRHAAQPSARLETRCEIRYIDEADVAPLVRSEGPGEAGSFVAAELGAARSTEERVRMIRSILHVIGFSGLGYAALKLDAQGQPERAYLLRDYLCTDLLPQSLAGGYFLRDPHMRRAFESNRPHVWDMRSLVNASRKDGIDPPLRRYFDSMRENGIASGLAFSLPISRTPMRALILFAGPPEHCEWITDSVIAQAIGVGLSLHQRCAAYVQAVCRQDVTGDLSALQQRILSAVVVGMSDKAIAARLNTTVHNVDYHLRQLREKFGARNRSQLAYLAGRTQAI